MSFMIAGAPKVRSNQVSAFGQKYFAQSFIRKDTKVERCKFLMQLCCKQKFDFATKKT